MALHVPKRLGTYRFELFPDLCRWAEPHLHVSHFPLIERLRQLKVRMRPVTDKLPKIFLLRLGLGTSVVALEPSVDEL